MLDVSLPQWQAGERRVRALDSGVRRPIDRVVEHLVGELRRRLGGSFSAQELDELYAGSTSWSMTMAIGVSPTEPLAWEQWVADAAFARYLRESRDWPLQRGGATQRDE